jgi:protein-disulfide isomerase
MKNALIRRFMVFLVSVAGVVPLSGRVNLPAPAVASAQERAALPSLELDTAGAASKGRTDAPVTMIEFSDFECPFCGRYSRDTYHQIVRDYVNTGKLRYLFRHFPIERRHRKALKASEAAECARVQGRFWEMHDRLFANQQTILPHELIQHAQAIGVNVGSFQQCLAGQATQKVKQDFADGMRAGIKGTPAFFIGTMTKEGKLKVVNKVTGAKPYATFKTAFDSVLALTGTKDEAGAAR